MATTSPDRALNECPVIDFVCRREFDFSVVEFANGKPLHLIDGPGLISICQEHHIPARILGLGTRRHRP